MAVAVVAVVVVVVAAVVVAVVVVVVAVVVVVVVMVDGRTGLPMLGKLGEHAQIPVHLPTSQQAH